jgi:hypothetical protein
MQNRLFIGYKNREVDRYICSGVRHANPHIEGFIILFGHPLSVCPYGISQDYTMSH